METVPRLPLMKAGVTRSFCVVSTLALLSALSACWMSLPSDFSSVTPSESSAPV